MKIYQNDKNGIAKLATLSDLVGGGINLLTGTNTGEGWNLSNGGFDDTANYANNKYSSLLKTKKVAHLWGDHASDASMQLNHLLHMDKGTYTISFVARNNGTNVPAFGLELYSSYTDTHKGLAYGKTAKPLSNEWNNYSITFNVVEYSDISSLRLVHWDSSAIIPGGSIYIANLKLEKGSVATPWSPSPLDILDEIETLKSKLGGVKPNYRLYYATSLKEVA